MHQRTSISKITLCFNAVLLMVCGVFIANLSQAANVEDDLQAPQHFTINHYEPLDYRFESPAETAANLSDSLTNDNDQTNTEVLVFHAYGKQFKLLLSPNTEMIANLPEKRIKNILQHMQLFAGVIDGIEESWVRITREDGKISGMFWDGSEIYIIDKSNELIDALPSDASAQTAYQLIYRLSDTESSGQQCAVDPAAKPLTDYSALVGELSSQFQTAQQAGSRLDVAVVADTQFVNNNSNPDSVVVARMNVVDGIYSTQLGVHLRLSEIRSLQSNSGLSSTNPSTLLGQFGGFSNSSGFNNPGLAHLFTGRNLDGSTIGIAYINSLCSDRFGVGISQVGGTGTLGALTVAHELGHNFGAPHDNQSGSQCASTPNGFIMNPSLNGADQFSQCSISQMQPSIQNAACIVNVDPITEADVSITFPINPITANIDQAFDYEIEFKNLGNVAATNVFSQISLPNPLNVQSVSVGGGSCANSNSGGLDCNLSNIGPGATKTVRIRLRASQVGNFNSSVNASADNDANPNNDDATITINVINTVSNSLIDANFDANLDGFLYRDDTFRNTDQPVYSRPQYRPGQGFSGGGVQVFLGGLDDQDINGMSGAWERNFQLDRPARLELSIRVKLSQANDYESDEFSEALAAIDNVLISSGNNGNLLSIRGDGNGGPIITTGWRQISIITGEFAPGRHTLRLGGFSNKKTFNDEITDILIDDVILTEIAGSNSTTANE